MPKILVLVTFTPDLAADRGFMAGGSVGRVSVPGRLSGPGAHAAGRRRG